MYCKDWAFAIETSIGEIWFPISPKTNLSWSYDVCMQSEYSELLIQFQAWSECCWCASPAAVIPGHVLPLRTDVWRPQQGWEGLLPQQRKLKTVLRMSVRRQQAKKAGEGGGGDTLLCGALRQQILLFSLKPTLPACLSFWDSWDHAKGEGSYLLWPEGLGGRGG